MVPHHDDLSEKELKSARKLLLTNLRKGRLLNGQVVGNCFTSYKDLADLLGYTIDSEQDGDRLGWVAGGASEIEYPKHNLLIGASVISKEFKRPGVGFYKLAEQLGLFVIPGKRVNPDGLPELTFFAEHMRKLIKVYGS